MTPTNVLQPANITVRSLPGTRDPHLLVQVIEQFQLETSGRYAVRDTSGDGRLDTFCNIFGSDFCHAMGVVFPHLVDVDGNPASLLQYIAKQARELSANAGQRWLHEHGARYGWGQVGQQQAMSAASAGHPALGTWDPPGIGHVVVLRPTEGDRCMVAQAGRHNFTKGFIENAFGVLSRVHPPVEFWVNE